MDDDSLEQMRQKFESAIAKMINDKRQNNIILPPARYENILAEVIQAKAKVTGKTPTEYRRLKRYDIMDDTNGQKVLVVPGTVGPNKTVKYYARSDELFNIIHWAHLSTNHGGREKVLNIVKANFGNVSTEIVMTYISGCPKCQYRHGFRKGDILKNKWRNLRDTYGKHLKSVSPYAGPNVKKSYKHWQWATHMEYFKPYLSYSYITTNEPEIIDIDNDTSSNVFGTGNDFNESQTATFDLQEQERHCYGQLQSVSSVIEQEIDFLPIVCKPKKQRQQEDSRYKLLDVQPMEDTLFQRYNENVHRSLELDATELIFLGYAKTIKTFSPRRQARMKVKLAQIITEEEEEDEEDVHQLQELALSSMSGPSSSDLIIPGGSPSSPGSVPIAPKKLSSVVPLSSTLPTTLPSASPSSSSAPPPPPEVCLRWNSYYSNMQATFPTLLNNEQFVDVTLACEGRSIKCHKVMLSACSSYFEELLSQNPCQHPIVFMRDLKFWEVQALVEFMYSGEVNVAQEKLPSLLAAAEALQIKGLTGPSQSSQQDESDYMPVQDSDEVPMSQSHKRVRKRKSTNPMAYPSRQPPQPQQSAKQMPMMHPIVQHSTSPSLSSTGGASSSGIAAQLPTSSPNRKESTSSSYHPPVKIKKERESTPPLALIKEEPLDLGKDSMETGSNNGQDLSNASSSYQASNYDRSHYSGRSLGKPQNGLSDEEDQDRLSTHSNQSDDAASLVEQKHDPGDDVSDA